MKPREKLRQLRRELKEEKRGRVELINALRYYGDRENYQWNLSIRSVPIVEEDGQRARRVLEKIKEKNNAKDRFNK